MTDKDERPEAGHGQQWDMFKVGCLSGLAANLCTTFVIALAVVWLHNKHRAYVDHLNWWPAFFVVITAILGFRFGRPSVTSKIHTGAFVILFGVCGLVIISWLLALLGEAAGIK
jgi:uncharacterized membrane protein YfcA